MFDGREAPIFDLREIGFCEHSEVVETPLAGDSGHPEVAGDLIQPQA